MKKVIQFLLILILVIILGLIIIFVFNPGDSRTKLIGNIINSYLQNNLSDYQVDKNTLINSDSNYDHPLLNESQESTLKNLGVDVSQLPSSISPEMEICFKEKFGEERVNEIINGDSPSVIELIKAKSCL